MILFYLAERNVYDLELQKYNLISSLGILETAQQDQDKQFAEIDLVKFTAAQRVWEAEFANYTQSLDSYLQQVHQFSAAEVTYYDCQCGLGPLC
jgi:hypothetical protein